MVGQRVKVVLAASAAVIASGLPMASVAQATSAKADTVLRGGYVYTVDRKNSVAQAVAIKDGQLVYVGTDKGVRGLIGRDTKVIDLDGRMVMPGLQDAHIHGVSVGNPFCDLEYRPLTRQDFVTRIEKCLANPQFGAEPDDWLTPENWYLQFMQPPGTKITKADLDAIDTKRPIMVSNWDGHTSLVNSRALALAKIDASTPDPADGVIEHDKNGEPNGYLQDGAQDLVGRVIPPGPPVDPVESARKGLRVLNKEGITSFYVPGTSESRIEAFEKLRRQGALTARAHFAMGTDPEDVSQPGGVVGRLRDARQRLESMNGLPRQVYAWRPHQRHKGPRLVARPGVSIDGVKVFLDGVIQAPAQTAAVLKPYLENVGTDQNPKWVPRTDEAARGQLYVKNPELGRFIAQLERSGMQTHLHSDGDRAVRVGLDAVESARHANRFIDSRPGFAHNELSDPADWRRFARLGALPVMSYQWAKPGPDNIDSVKNQVGPERWNLVEAVGAMHKAGARIVFGSDYPVDPLNEWLAIEVAVLREADWDEDFPEFDFPQYAGKLNADPGLTLQQAIRGITLNAAFSMHQDEVTGSLEKGKLADLVVLNQNLFKIRPDDISKTKVLMTMVGGNVVYKS